MEQEELTPTAAPSEMRRLTGTFFEPGAVFPDIAANGRWWLASLILVVLISTYFALVIQRVGVDQLIVKSMETNKRTQEMTPEQKAQAIEMQRKIMPIAWRVGPGVSMVVVILLVSGVLLFIFNFMFGAELKYKHVLNIYTYSGVPISIVSTAASILVLFLKPPDEYDLQHPLAFNVGAFLPETMPKWLQALGSSLDAFTIWQIILVAVAFSAVCGARKMPFGRALTGVLLPWAAYVLAKMTWAAMFG